MKLYAASLLAQKHEGDVLTTGHATMVLPANDMNSAYGQAYLECKKSYPREEGYSNHDVVVVQVSDWVFALDERINNPEKD